MSNIPLTQSEINEMLDSLCIENVNDLFNIIPEKFKFNINQSIINESLSEYQLAQNFQKISNNNLSASNSLFFMGGGVYDHYVPKIVDTLSSRSEFYTAYTPYQPEVSQGTLQYLYEFQSMISALSDLDVSNASLYDGASALAEACSMALNIAKKNKILLSSAINPNYLDVVKTYLSQRDVDLEFIPLNSGLSNIKKYS